MGPSWVRAGDCGLLLLLLLFPAGLFITAAYLSSSWSSTCSRRAFDVPPCVSLPPPPTPPPFPSCWVCLSECECVQQANAVNRRALPRPLCCFAFLMSALALLLLFMVPKLPLVLVSPRQLPLPLSTAPVAAARALHSSQAKPSRAEPSRVEARLVESLLAAGHS